MLNNSAVMGLKRGGGGGFEEKEEEENRVGIWLGTEGGVDFWVKGVVVELGLQELGRMSCVCKAMYAGLNLKDGLYKDLVGERMLESVRGKVDKWNLGTLLWGADIVNCLVSFNVEGASEFLKNLREGIEARRVEAARKQGYDVFGEGSKY